VSARIRAVLCFVLIDVRCFGVPQVEDFCYRLWTSVCCWLNVITRKIGTNKGKEIHLVPRDKGGSTMEPVPCTAQTLGLREHVKSSVVSGQ
jgi:hypothetical protein